MPETHRVQICQACGSPSTSGFSHDLGEGDVHELCGDCAAVSDAICFLRGVSHDPPARRARVARILELLDQADELVDERYGDQPSRLAEWFREEDDKAA